MIFDLNDSNFLIYTAKCYDRPHILQSEFEADLSRIKYVKKLLKRYRQTGECNERLILNHIIILSNCFGVEPTVNMLFLKVEPEDYPLLKTFLIFLNYLPDHLKVTFNKYYIRQEEIPVILPVAKRLKDL